MRWERLFADLEAQLEQDAVSDLRAEVADRARAEHAQVWLADRVRAHVGEVLTLHLQHTSGSEGGADAVEGRVLDVGPDWVVLGEGPARGGRAALVPLGAVSSVGGLSRLVAPPAGEVLRRLSVRSALRALARDRSAVRVTVPGAELTGTLDRVAADHVDLALHPPGEPRRAGQVLTVRAVPIAAVLVVRST